MKTENIVAVIVGIALIIGAYFLFFNKNNDIAPDTTEEKTDTEIKTNEIVTSFVEKYKANKEIPDSATYSYQLEDILVKSGKPIVFSAEMSDIFRKNGRLFVRFMTPYLRYSDNQIIYTLTGCDEKLLQIDGSKQGLWDEYVVVAKIDKITKPLVKIDAYSIDEEEAEIELSAAQTFLATGACLDFEYIKNENL